MVTEGYFGALAIQLKSGRGLAATDVAGAPPVAVINEAMAKKFFPEENPVGQRVLYQEQLYAKRQMGRKIAFEIVGVVGNEMVRLGEPTSPVMYMTFEQQPTNNFSLIVKGAGGSDGLVRPIRHAVQTVDAGQALTGVFTLDRFKAEMMSPNSLRATLLAVFAAIALALAAVGIYGVISYSVAQQTHEMGVRLALGASRGAILGLVIRQGMIFTFIGLAIGAAGSYGLAKLIKAMLYGVTETDSVTLAGVVTLLAGIALLACYLPARRATRIDPLIALRQE
jgi:putative ABC transport system permease protein